MHRIISARLLILIFVLITCEYSLSGLSLLLKGRIDLLYLLVLDYAFFGKWEHVPFFAFATGLLRDCIGGHLFGIETASLTVTGLLAYFAVLKLEREIPWVRIVITSLFVFLTETISLSLGSGLEVGGGLTWALIEGSFWTTVYTTAFSPVFFWLTNHWFHRMVHLKQYELFQA